MVRIALTIFTFLALLESSLACELFISAAMGVKDCIQEVGNNFKSKTGCRVVFNFSSSGKLAKQIESGAPADLYVSASKFWMSYLIKKGIVCRESVLPFASTKLVLVAPKGSNLKSLLEAGRIAVGDRLAPVGKYAIEVLKNLGLYKKLEGKFIFSPTVRQITIWVSTGNVDAGIIYYSDYLKFRNRLKLVKVFPEELHTPVMFYVGIVKSSRDKETCMKFENFLLSQDEKLLNKYGFFKVGEK